MQECILPFDIFRHLLTLNNYYLPVSSFLALRAACKHMRAIYTKQKYIDKYSSRIIKPKYKFGRRNRRIAAKIRVCNILPNQKIHGTLEKHYFGISDHRQYHSNPENKARYSAAMSYGLNMYYLRSHTLMYYLGNPIWPKICNEKLIGDNAIRRFILKIDDILKVSYWFDTPIYKPIDDYINKFDSCECLLRK